MDMRWNLLRRIAGAGALGAVLIGVAWTQHNALAQTEGATQASLPEPRQGRYTGSGAELAAGQWKGGGGLGFLGSTPDGAALAMNGTLDYFVDDRVSVGPLLQVGVTDDMTQVGLSGQAKYWIDLPGTEGRGKAVLQSGVGFAHTDIRGGDTSWLVPLGVGYDYTLNSGASLTATALVNFTHLRPGGDGADIMPGLTFGVRF